MIKKLLSALVLSVFCFGGLTALAAGRTFGPFTVEVPAGWKTEFNDEGESCALYLHQENSQVKVYFALGNLEGETLDEMMKFMAENPEPGSSRPQKQNDGTWLVNTKDPDSQLPGWEIYSLVDDYYFSIQGVSGEDPDIKVIFDSFTMDGGSAY